MHADSCFCGLVAVVSLKAAYGDSVLTYESDLLKRFVQAAHAISEVGNSSGAIIDLIPICKSNLAVRSSSMSR